MRAERGGIPLLGLHLKRLASSARALGYRYDEDTVRERLAAALVGAPAEARARLTLEAGGGVEVEVAPLDGAPLRTAWVDPEPLAEAGTWRCLHKTTARGHYGQRHERALARGADEAVLLNERGEVTEGTRTTVWAETDGRLWTPPVEAGGLPGVFRAHALAADDRTGERPLTPADLRAADAVWLTNAVRGWMRVRLVGSAP